MGSNAHLQIMNEITKRLIDLDSSLVLHNEGAWEKPLDESISGGYTSFNDAGIETETGEFLYGLARILKPKNILETGTHWGVGAAYMGMALKDNKQGELDTIEFLPEIFERATKLMANLGLGDVVHLHKMDAANFEPGEPGKYKLILLDTEPQTRFAELEKFYPYLADGGFVFIHDLHQHMHQIENEEHGFAWPFGKIPQRMLELVVQGKLRPMHLPTPRGLTGFYKPGEKDYKWESKG